MVPFRIRVVDTYIDCDKSGFYFYWIFFGATSLTAWGNSIKMMYLMASALRHTRCGFATRSNHDEKWLWATYLEGVHKPHGPVFWTFFTPSPPWPRTLVDNFTL